MAGKILVPNRSFVVWDQGRMVRFLRGRTTIREGHPLLAGNEDRFEPLKVTYDVLDKPKATTSSAPPTPPPAAAEAGSDDDLTCPDCGFVAGSKIGLASHIRAKHPD